MIEPIFEGVSARCKNHSTLLPPGERECEECKLIRRNLSLNPPFDVIANKTYFGVKKDTLYTVVWLIRDGVRDNNVKLRGYVFKDKDGKPCEHVYDPVDFTPIAFLDPEEVEESEAKKEEEVEVWYG